MLLVVNYHYIGEAKFPHPGIHPLPPKVFRRQIEALARYFEFVAEEDLLAALDGQRSLPDKACLLTFDDGLQEQYTSAVPALDDLKVPAIFFVPGQPYLEGKPLAVHRIHWLRSQTEPETFRQLLFSGCERLGNSTSHTEGDIGYEGKYFWDDEETRKAKYLLNILLTEVEKDRLLSLMEKQVSFDGEVYFASLYMTPGQIEELGQRFAVGTHGYSHAPLARRNRFEIEADIIRGLTALSPLCKSPVSISYPHGYEGAISQAVFDMARSCGLRLGFTTERSFNLTLQAPLALARVDTNDVPVGKRPIILPGENGYELRGAMTLGRTRFLHEAEEP